jgi:hypothetical protein
MDLDTALKGMIDAENSLRTKQGINNPAIMSEAMMRLSQYTGSVEEHLADLERDAELEEARIYQEMKAEGKSPSAAEKEAKYAIASFKADIKRLTRLTTSAWRQVGVIQSRINHLIREAQI